MSLIDTLMPRPRVEFPDKTPVELDAKLRRGREARDKDKTKRELFRKFWEGDHYSFLTANGNITHQVAGPAGVSGNNKQAHRIRNTYNFTQSIVESKVSAATQQVPGYEVTPSTGDYEDEAAASLAAQVAVFGYDKWRIRRHTTKAVTDALVSREGFVMPYFDQNMGPFEDGKGQGEIRLLNFSRDEVMWEPGDDFDDSRWYAIERTMRLEEIRAIPGFVRGSIEEKDDTLEWSANNEKKGLTVTEYLERPCPKWPSGRRMFFCSGRPIVDFRRTLPEDEDTSGPWWEPYPLMDANGTVADEPILHRISYTVNPHGDDMGLVERLIDLQRTVNDTWNKILEIKNRALLLQSWTPKGAGVPRRDDTPGANYEYNGDKKPEWEKAPDPALLGQLLEIHREAISELRALAADVDIQPEARLAEGTAQLAQTTSAARWASFLGDLAEFHSRLMRHCLTLVALHYEAERQIDIRGQYGWEPMDSFSSQDLRSQVNVRVNPGSLATQSRQAIQAEIQFIQANFPGYLTPQMALGALHGGSASGLINSYRNHVARANRIVRRLQASPDAIESFGTRFDPKAPNWSAVIDPETNKRLVDPMTGVPLQPPLGADVPGWMPGPQDNDDIWRTRICDYMTTEHFERLDPAIQANFYLVLEGLDEKDRQRAAAAAAQQEMQAQSLGMNNAGKSPSPPPLPDRAGFSPGSNKSAVPTPS